MGISSFARVLWFRNRLGSGFAGDLVSFYTRIIKIGNTSITVLVTVDARRANAPHETVRVTQAEVVYVAVDQPGKPVPLK